MSTEYRPEQLWAADIINACLPPGFVMGLEHELTDLHDVGEMKAKYACPDIVILSQHRTVAIRMQGSIHKKKKQRMKEEDQKVILEGNGWDVVDFWFDVMTDLWTNNRSDKETRIKATRGVLAAIEFIY